MFSNFGRLLRSVFQQDNIRPWTAVGQSLIVYKEKGLGWPRMNLHWKTEICYDEMVQTFGAGSLNPSSTSLMTWKWWMTKVEDCNLQLNVTCLLENIFFLKSGRRIPSCYPIPNKVCLQTTLFPKVRYQNSKHHSMLKIYDTRSLLELSISQESFLPEYKQSKRVGQFWCHWVVSFSFKLFLIYALFFVRWRFNIQCSIIYFRN